ncbi:MAG: YezD family protein [Sinimarinibacterium sp.]
MTQISVPQDTTRRQLVDHVVQALDGLDFGAVEITVHHGRIVQIERREKVRVDAQHPVRPQTGATSKPTDRTSGSL